jgi:phospholipid transport system substrate-binding protein
MRATGGQWKVIDVLYRSSMSQLASRHADFASTLAREARPP